MSIAAINTNHTEQIGAQSDLLMLLLQEQQELTAVDRFSQYHETVSCPESRPTYETLLPVTPLEPGEQYAFSVDLDRCSGCKACVVACHNQNGLDEKEAWRDVGLLYSTSQALPVMQHITAACHHCVNPACMNACPTNSYEKDPVTGIVRHLDDQCFGCQYCTLACPYGVPKYHAEKGIVRKCDMCSQRLAKNEAPACVQSCPHEAISITKIKQSEAREKGIAGTFLAGTHNPSYTVPTTIYHSNRLENINSSEPDPGFLVRGDEHALHPEHAHWPLILMLTLIQLSVGIFLGLSLLQALGQIPLNGARWLALTGFGISQLALAFATLHLGRPHYMFRGILGFRHSWMSREIVAFGIYSAAAGTCLASFWLPATLVPFQGLLQTISPWLTVATGYLGLFCSMMIYQCTQRIYWNGVDTSLKFFGTTVVTGFAFLTVVLPLLETFMGISIPLGLNSSLITGLMISLGLKTAADLHVLRFLHDNKQSSMKRSAQLLAGPLMPAVCLRMASSLAVLLTSVSVLFSTEPLSLTLSVTIGLLLFTATLLGEMTERYLFFTAVVAPCMPRGIA